MALITTPGAVDADSYASLVEADAYHAAHLWATTWDAASVDRKEAALRMATRLLDRMPRAWTGAVETETQGLRWPRSGMLTRDGYEIAAGTIPPDLKDAEAEFARQLLAEDRTEDNSALASDLQSLKAGPVTLTFARKDGERLALERRDSLEAMVPEAVIGLLVPSWLLDVREEDEDWTGFVFEAD